MVKDANAMWDEAIKNLEERVEKKEVLTIQRDAILKVWEELSKKNENLVKPFLNASAKMFGWEDDTDYYFNWVYDKAPGVVVSIFIRKNGHYEWYFNNSTTGNSFDGNGDLKAVLEAFDGKLSDMCEKK